MRKRSVKINTRDPKPQSRDPLIEQPAPVPEPKAPIPAVHVQLTKCPHCGEPGPWRQGGTTNPNPLTKQMVRWRECTACHKTHNQIWPMTPREIERYCGPD
jgi:hypothetical protein